MPSTVFNSFWYTPSSSLTGSPLLAPSGLVAVPWVAISGWFLSSICSDDIDLHLSSQGLLCTDLQAVQRREDIMSSTLGIYLTLSRLLGKIIKCLKLHVLSLWEQIWKWLTRPYHVTQHANVCAHARWSMRNSKRLIFWMNRNAPHPMISNFWQPLWMVTGRFKTTWLHVYCDLRSLCKIKIKSSPAKKTFLPKYLYFYCWFSGPKNNNACMHCSGLKSLVRSEAIN